MPHDIQTYQQYYQALADHLRDGLVVYRAVDNGNDFLIIEFNPAAERIEQIRKEQVLGQRLSKVFPGVAPFGLLEVLRRVWQTGRTEHFPVHRYVDDRISGWRENLVYRLPSGDVVALYSDETQHKQYEQDLKRTNQAHKAALAMARLGYWQYDAARRRVEWSDQMFSLLGRDPALGVPSLDEHLHLIHPEDRNLIAKTTRRALEKGESSEVVVRILMPNQNVRWLTTQCHPQYNESGAITGLNGIILDITEIKEAEMARESLELQLHRSQKMEALGTITGGIAHDFNNILGIILGNAELAKDEVPPTSAAKGNLDEIVQATLRAKEIIRQLLSFARDPSYKPVPTDLGRIVEESIQLIRAAVPANIQIRQAIRSSHPIIHADASQIRQILLNLCTNAMHAMEPDGGLLEIAVHEVKVAESHSHAEKRLTPGDYLCLSVRDTGHGIDPECIERIFDPYFTTKEVGKGSGLGLAVVHGIVQKHGAMITVESKKGRGTLFSIFFPRCQSPDGAANSGTATKGHESILVVDDEKSLANAYRKILQQSGYQVTTAENGEQALSLIQKESLRFDLVISDMAMPGMRGDVLAQQIRITRPDLPVLLCTGFSAQMTPEKARAMGVHFTEKPIGRHSLTQLVRRILDGKR